MRVLAPAPPQPRPNLLPAAPDPEMPREWQRPSPSSPKRPDEEKDDELDERVVFVDRLPEKEVR